MARSRLMRVLLGTSPGLERLLFASVPALVVGALSSLAFGGWIGLAIGLAILAVLIALSRGISS